MTLPLNQITQNKLVLVKQLYQTAFAQSSVRYSAVSRIMAVIGFDLSVETILKVIVSTLETKDQPDNTFVAILQQANEKLSKAGYPTIPDQVNIRHVHSIRNDSQHKVKYPSESDVVDCRIYVRDFLQKLIRQLWDISFESISLVDLIQGSTAKHYLSNSESAFGRGDYEETVKQANTGLAWATSRVRRQLFGARTNLEGSLIFSNLSEELSEETDEYTIDILNDAASGFENAFVQVRDEISRKLDYVQDALLRTNFGMNYAGYLRLSLMAEYVDFQQDGSPAYQKDLFKKTANEDDAQFALQYCTDAVIQIEAQFGNIDMLQ